VKLRPFINFLITPFAGYLLFVIGSAAGVMLLSNTSLSQPSILQNRVSHPLMDFLYGLTMVLGVAGAARIFKGSFFTRWALLALFTYVLGYVMSAWEASYFTKFGGTEYLLVMGILPSLFCPAVFAWRRKTLESPQPILKKVSVYFRGRSVKSWAWRLTAAWLSFPIIYFIFGSMAGPIVVPYYKSLDFLTLPPMDVLIQVQLTRSLVILAVILPVFIYSEAGSRISLIMTLSWSFYALMGLNGMIAADFFPTAIRWAHGVELLADSIAYALATVFLLASAPPAAPETK
jgi:hypothetical protein